MPFRSDSFGPYDWLTAIIWLLAALRWKRKVPAESYITSKTPVAAVGLKTEMAIKPM